MDVFAHGFWAAAGAAAANTKMSRKLRPGWAALWGMFPDLFAFTLPVLMGLWTRLADPARWAGARGRHEMPYMSLGWQLYQVSHSLIVFALVFGLLWLLRRRPVYEMLGWALHILIDIPTHTARFFPTPFLWPVSAYKASGISWGNRWFMLSNYTALTVVWFLLWRRRRRQRSLQVHMSELGGRETVEPRR